MENDERLDNAVKNIEEFKLNNTQILKSNIDEELISFRKTLPKEILTEELELKIENEVNDKLVEFKKDIELKPKALYYSLKSELELNEDITEKELTISAYDLLEKNTRNKFLKKIFRELRKENK